MKKEYKALGTIRGTRYFVEVIKTCKGIPGFAPEEYDRKVCDVVFNFPHGEEGVYFQFDDRCPTLEQSELEELLSISKEEFKEDNFHFEPKPL